ncbi:MAG: DUF2804 domain-containing protein [Clostridia bacterium]|nr:DUF2804 domain-containing protein [Clostridia bacterium]
MMFEQFLSEKRLPVPTPESVVDASGKVAFGTFDKEFKNMNFLDVNKPSILPNSLNKYRLTLWEAVEVNFEDVTLLTAVCDMGIFGTALTILYDKASGKVTSWAPILKSGQFAISENLLDGAKTWCKNPVSTVKFINNFQDGKAEVCGQAASKDGSLSYNVKLTRVSDPSVVVIPFGDNRPLYTQKDLFKVEGYLEINGKRYMANENTAAVIDDHRGYYPYRAHYDWVSTMGTAVIDGKKQYFGFNLTRNQSINQDDYNENLIWFEGSSTRLTPVKFEHINGDPFKWYIYDEYGMVKVFFDITDEHLMRVPAGLIDINYHVDFGTLRGYLCKPDGTKIVLDGMTGIGEDKSLRF